MSKPIEDAPTASAFISHDVPCHRCAYNLRGLPRDGRCPECGAPTRVSLQGDLLRFADPAWLRKLLLGAKLPYYALYTLFITVFVGQLSSVALRSYLGRSDLGVFPAVYITTSIYLGGGVLLWSLWLISAPEPANRERENWHAPRRVLRVAALVAGLGLGPAVLLPLLASKGATWLLATLILSPFGLAGLVGAWAMCRYMAQLADRALDAFTRGKAETYMIGTFASWPLFAMGALTAVLRIHAIGVLLLLLGAVGLLSFGVLSFALPSYLTKKLKEEMEKAQTTWTEADKAADGTHASGVQSPPANIQRAQRDSEAIP